MPWYGEPPEFATLEQPTSAPRFQAGNLVSRSMICLFVSSAASLSLASWHMLFRCATGQFFVLGAWAENWLKGTATLLECGVARTLQETAKIAVLEILWS